MKFENLLSDAFIARVSKAVKLPMTNLKRLESYKAIIAACEKHGVTSPAHIAYILATAAHESRLLPIKEIKASASSEIWIKYQSKYWHTGFFGRGFVQLTHERNYLKFSKLLGIDLVNNPDIALDVYIAAEILVIGMRDGLFTKHSLVKHFPLSDNYTASTYDDVIWYYARRIVNGVFRAKEVSNLAINLYKLLI